MQHRQSKKVRNCGLTLQVNIIQRINPVRITPAGLTCFLPDAIYKTIVHAKQLYRRQGADWRGQMHIGMHDWPHFFCKIATAAIYRAYYPWPLVLPLNKSLRSSISRYQQELIQLKRMTQKSFQKQKRPCQNTLWQGLLILKEVFGVCLHQLLICNNYNSVFHKPCKLQYS